jgi:hypothetical protein
MLPIFLQSTPNILVLVGYALMKFTVFITLSSTDFNPSGMHLKPRACLWMLQCMQVMSDATIFVQAINPA